MTEAVAIASWYIDKHAYWQVHWSESGPRAPGSIRHIVRELGQATGCQARAAEILSATPLPLTEPNVRWCALLLARCVRHIAAARKQRRAEYLNPLSLGEYIDARAALANDREDLDDDDVRVAQNIIYRVMHPATEWERNRNDPR